MGWTKAGFSTSPLDDRAHRLRFTAGEDYRIDIFRVLHDSMDFALPLPSERDEEYADSRRAEIYKEQRSDRQHQASQFALSESTDLRRYPAMR